MKIKELSSITKIPIPTIRYYEQIGCINPKKKGYYKIYTEDILEELLAIKKFQSAGLKLKDIIKLFSMNKETNELTSKEVTEISDILHKTAEKIKMQEILLLESKMLITHMIDKLENLYEASK